MAGYVHQRIQPATPLARMCTLIDHGLLRFMILDCPTDNSLPQAMKVFAANAVSDVVRVCDPTYLTDRLLAANITVHDWPFPDGGVPPAHVIANFLQLVEARYGPPSNTSSSLPISSLAQAPKRPSSSASDDSLDASRLPSPTIAVHCVAGLGRAPMLVAIALIEYGFQPLQAIEYVRARRRGAFNTAQVKYIDAYKPSYFAKKHGGLLRLRSSVSGNQNSAAGKSFKRAMAKLFQRKKSLPQE